MCNQPASVLIIFHPDEIFSFFQYIFIPTLDNFFLNPCINTPSEFTYTYDHFTFFSLLFIIPMFSYKFITNTVLQISLSESDFKNVKTFLLKCKLQHPQPLQKYCLQLIYSVIIFQERTLLVTYDCGNDIFEEGDEPKGIYIIISGMVKVRQSYL